MNSIRKLATRVSKSASQLALLRELASAQSKPERVVFVGSGTGHRLPTGRALSTLGLVTMRVSSERVETTARGRYRKSSLDVYSVCGEVELTELGRQVLVEVLK